MSETLTLHELMVELLASGGWMTVVELADRVNDSGRHEKRDGSNVEPGQILLRAKASGGRYAHLFEVQADRIRLARTE